MIRSDKEFIERFYLEILREKLQGLPVEEPEKCERPDFVWTHLQEPLGVEITRLFKDPRLGQRPMQVQESEQAAIVESACQIHRQRKLPKLDVRVMFGSGNFTKTNRKRFANRLADAVQKQLPVTNACVSIRNDFSDDSSLPEVISYLSIASIKGLKTNHWSAASAGFFQEDFTAELQHRIIEKNNELPAYLTRCSHCWLLVVADGGGPSSFFALVALTLLVAESNPKQKDVMIKLTINLVSST